MQWRFMRDVWGLDVECACLQPLLAGVLHGRLVQGLGPSIDLARYKPFDTF